MKFIRRVAPPLTLPPEDQVQGTGEYIDIDVVNLPYHLPDSIEFSPDEDFEQFIRRVPAKGAVYLIADASDKPVQLLCVRNLRNSLKRRLGSEENLGPTRQVNYREFVRRIHWRRVDSAFEADWIYCEAARDIFPQFYKAMLGFRPAWFVHVDPNANFPRYTKTVDLSARTGIFLGPLEDKHAASRWIELIEDTFDLCRFHNILLESPHAKPCAYKEMGKCPAPCDGSISMGQYRLMIEWSLSVILQPAPFIDAQTQRMQQAASELRFESAQKIKAFLGRLSELGNGAFRQVRRLSDFRFIVLQRGPREKTVKVFLVTLGQIQEILGLIAEPLRSHELMAGITQAIEKQSLSEETSTSELGINLIGVVAQHLFNVKQNRDMFLPLEWFDERSLIKAYRDLQKHKIPNESDDEEGLVKELQSL